MIGELLVFRDKWDGDDFVLHLRRSGFLGFDLQPLRMAALMFSTASSACHLGMAAWQRRTTDRPSFCGLNQANSILMAVFVPKFSVVTIRVSRRFWSLAWSNRRE